MTSDVATPALTPLDALAPQHAATLADLAARRLELKQVIAVLEADEAAHKFAMEELARELGLAHGVEYDGGGDEAKRWRFALTKGRRALSREKLLDNGVSARTIELSMVEGKGSWRLTGASTNANMNANGGQGE